MARWGKLVVRRGDEAREVVIPSEGLTIGRAPDNQVVLDQLGVSRHHARLAWSDGQLQLTDLGSENGTRLNTTDLEPRVPRPVAGGDAILIGQFSLAVQMPSEAAAQPPATAVRMSVPAVPRLLVAAGDWSQAVLLDRDALTIGRDKSNDVVVDDPAISRRHARVQRVEGGFEIVDLGSVNGLRFDGQLFQSRRLAEGEAVHLSQAVTVSFQAAPAAAPAVAPVVQLDLRAAGRQQVRIGRGADNDLRLDQHLGVSRHHARIARVDGTGYVIEDLGSTNGTYVNGQRLAQGQLRLLQPDDAIRVGSVKLVFTPDSLSALDESRDIRLDALHLTHVVGQGRTLLHDISLSIFPREFVALVGVSGAGKSTLMNALSGFRPARAGEMRVNGTSLYDNFDAYRNELGYVPQADIIHKELSVYEALEYAARLRLPADTTPGERHARIMEVVETLLLSERRDTPIHRLSGGQLKRVSIGVELLTEPGLFFLDEATSGLDPGTESQMMRLLRKLADQGRTIILITHATKNVMQCDQVIFLAKGGHLAYYGPPEDALAYFGVKEFDAIYEKLENELSPETWAARYRNSPQYRQYVVERLTAKYGEAFTSPGTAAPAEKEARPGRTQTAPKRVSGLRQFLTLSRRNLAILRRDRASLVLMLLSAPFIGLLNYLTWKQGVFNTDGGNVGQGLTDLFLMALNGFFIGAVSSMREIVKEDDIYRRERMVVLKLGPYVLSKTWIGVALALYQAAVFLIIAKLGSGWPDTWAAAGATYLTVFLTGMAGIFFGLLISAVSPNQNVTPLLLIVVIIPQMLFAGGMLPVSTFGPAGPFLSRLTATRWGFESLVTISEIGQGVSNDACWRLTEAERDALTEAQKVATCDCMGPNLFHRCQFPGLAQYYDTSVDQPEPVQPAEPGPPPEPPVAPTPPATSSPEDLAAFKLAQQQFQADLVKFGDDLAAYQKTADAYKADLEVWRDQFQDWKEKRGKAVGQAEAVMERINDDFGEMFDVNLAVDWGVLAGMMVLIIALVTVAQKRKDVV